MRQPPGSKPRFSLLTLLLITTFIALAVGLLAVWRNNRRLTATNVSLEAENRRLRDEVGELSIDDPSLLHAMRVRTDTELEWKWHAWVKWTSKVSTTSGVGTSTEVFPQDQIVELCRHRVGQTASSLDIEDPAAGFLVWLERVK